MGEFRPSRPGERRGGRSKGTPNKVDATIKELVLGALSDVGGRKYLAERAIDQPVAFLALIGKVLPLQLTGPEGEALKITVITGVPRDDEPPTIDGETAEIGHYQIDSDRADAAD